MLTACDSAAPDSTLAPTAGSPRFSVGASAVVSTKDLKKAATGAALIDQSGGQLSVGGHNLTVPANAVSEATWFTMQVVEANKIHVKLRAQRASDLAAVTQFPIVPVRIDFDASTVDVLDISSLSVVYLVDGTYDGAKEYFTSTVNLDTKRVSADLSHFSDYTLGNGKTDECVPTETDPCP